MLINESFQIKTGSFEAKDGRKFTIAYIDGLGKDKYTKLKDKLSNKFGVKWMGVVSKYGWFINQGDPEDKYNRCIVPCAKFLQTIEQTDDVDFGEDEDGNPLPQVRTYLNVVEGLIDDINSGTFEPVEQKVAVSKEEIKAKLDQFYDELLSLTSMDEFKKMMEPFIKWRNAHGHELSFHNQILVWVQDPEATMVHARTTWRNIYNREVKPNSPVIYINRPNGGGGVSKDEKARIEAEFLKRHGYKSVKELPAGLKDKLRVELNGNNKFISFTLAAYYDVRFTEQIPGTEDVVGSNNSSDIPWFDESGEETDESVRLYDAVCELIQETGIKLSYADKIHGDARGVSTGGEIQVLNNIPKNQGSISTLVHEFSHELLHQSYLNKSRKGSEWSSYFIGTSQGRAVVEQQAEISAWIVMRFFGYDMPTSINYAGLWGMDEKKAHLVFKTVADVATKIINELQKKLYGNDEGKANESILKEVDGNGARMVKITGYDLANMLGLGDLYMKSVKSDKAVQECFDFAKRLAKI